MAVQAPVHIYRTTMTTWDFQTAATWQSRDTVLTRANFHFIIELALRASNCLHHRATIRAKIRRESRTRGV